MLARCGAAGFSLVILATSLFACAVIGRETPHVVLMVGAYASLCVSAVVFLAGAAAHAARAPDVQNGRLDPVTDGDADAAKPPATVDDLVGMLGTTLKLASPIPAGALEAVDVADLLSALADRTKSARLRLDVPPAPLHTLANRVALARALDILVDNALASGLRASISCDRGSSALVVHVDDDGPGVPRAIRRRVFDWHYYVTTPPSEQTACCVELVIARRIVRAHGGDIAVSASPLGGARFTARMPLLNEHEIEIAAAS